MKEKRTLVLSFSREQMKCIATSDVHANTIVGVNVDSNKAVQCPLTMHLYGIIHTIK